MSDFDETVLSMAGISDYGVEVRYTSKRNLVYRIVADGRRYIYKHYIAGDATDDVAMLSRLQEIDVPQVLASTQDAVLYSYIDGQNLLDVLLDVETTGESFDVYINMLLDFLDGFYREMPGYIWGDINLRNFIVSSGRIYGVDVEDIALGEVYDDIGRIGAFIQTYHPVFTQYRVDVASRWLQMSSDRLELDRTMLDMICADELESIRDRRG